MVRPIDRAAKPRVSSLARRLLEFGQRIDVTVEEVEGWLPRLASINRAVAPLTNLPVGLLLVPHPDQRVVAGAHEVRPRANDRHHSISESAVQLYPRSARIHPRLSPFI